MCVDRTSLKRDFIYPREHGYCNGREDSSMRRAVLLLHCDARPRGSGRIVE
jgi:hypothetical protein